LLPGQRNTQSTGKTTKLKVYNANETEWESVAVHIGGSKKYQQRVDVNSPISTGDRGRRPDDFR